MKRWSILDLFLALFPYRKSGPSQIKGLVLLILILVVVFGCFWTMAPLF